MSEHENEVYETVLGYVGSSILAQNITQAVLSRLAELDNE